VFPVTVTEASLADDGLLESLAEMKSDLKKEMKEMSVSMLENIQSVKESRVEVEG
jgi:hypothetical protein